ncbi:MAG TPA: isoprenylcysteine carboxylmethyltransferase family protein, partial [Blastocatellia bacterium]|nr:isoprenylcysteine carboxylmethyltransferase family protein [Blastocatellia bacterium]
MVLLKTIIFTIIVPGTVLVWMPYLLLTSNSVSSPPDTFGLRYLGGIPILLGATIILWCAWDFTFAGKGTPAPIDPPKRLVVRGLYRHVRNPMYVGVLSVITGEALLFQSLALIEYAAVAFVCVYLFVIFYEEPTLSRKFGESYKNYRE